MKIFYRVLTILGVVLGSAFTTTILSPPIHEYFAKKIAHYENEVTLKNDIISDFASYREYRNKLNVITRHEVKSGGRLSEEEQVRKNSYVQLRDKYATSLTRDLNVAMYTFNEDTRKLISQYLEWAGKNADKTITHQPSDREYNLWQNKIVFSIKQQIN